MSPTGTDEDQVDLDISIAAIALRAAREAVARCPSGENQAAVAAAEQAVDRLLDVRLARRR